MSCALVTNNPLDRGGQKGEELKVLVSLQASEATSACTPMGHCDLPLEKVMTDMNLMVCLVICPDRRNRDRHESQFCILMLPSFRELLQEAS